MAKIILNKSNYFHNLKIISEKAGGKDKVAVVLKDNAYGHGILEISKLAYEFGIKKAVVRTLEEAAQIESFFEQILILADTPKQSCSHTFHIVINSLEQINKIPQNTNVHLKVDTGMHRSGINPNELEEAILGIKEAKLKLNGVMTHHRSADEVSCEYFWQREIFKEVKINVKKICEQNKMSIPDFHQANSSALFRFKNFDEDICRVGIAQYGYLENNKIFKNPNLRPVMELWADKISTKIVKKNQKIGYGGKFLAKEDTPVSIYNVGYGDGFLRLDGTKNYFLDNGSQILGRVSMDCVSINSEDDEICIFKDVRKLAKIHGTISYEITTTLSQNIKKEIR